MSNADALELSVTRLNWGLPGCSRPSGATRHTIHHDKSTATMRHVIVGGGIAGVCCVDELCRLRPDDEVVLVSASTLLKARAAACSAR